MPRRTSDADPTPARVVIVTLDSHLASAVDRARASLQKDIPNLSLVLHAAADWTANEEALKRCKEDIARGDIVIVTMLFMEEHIRAVLPALKARRERCDAMVVGMSAGEVIRLTKLGKFSMDKRQGGALALLKRLRGGSSNGKPSVSSGAKQMAMLRRLPQILRFIPGAAQDLRAYFLTLQYWLAGSDENVVNLVKFLLQRYASGPREVLRQRLTAKLPVEYPEVGLYHPRLADRIAVRAAKLPKPKKASKTVGLLIMRSYVLAGNTAHYDGVIAAFEARGFRVIPAFASGLDARPAIETFFKSEAGPLVDAVVSLTGFSLVGGPAYNDSKAAEDTIAELDVPYLAAQAVEFQTLEQWQESDRGLLPVEATLMVSIPELDGATGPMLFGGRSTQAAPERPRDMQSLDERAGMLAARVDRMIALRSGRLAERKLAIALFNFPPNGGNTGSAAHLSVYASLFNTLKALKQAGYTVELPESVDALRETILVGNAARFGTEANVQARISADDHVRREPWLSEIESQWGAAPGRHLSDGASIFVLGAQFGNVFVGVQPPFGYEGDPMRLLFEKGLAPTHAFAGFYRYIREDFGADAILHFGTHGALEFMPGKQVALSEDCWPDRLIGDLPNFYLYAANNPSEGLIAKRRAAATLVSYLTPPVTNAGLYRGLLDIKSSVERWRGLDNEAPEEREELAALIQAQASELELAELEPAWNGSASREIDRLGAAILELEYTLIPHGLHEVGRPATEPERIDFLSALAEASHDIAPEPAAIEALARGSDAEQALAIGGMETSESNLIAFEALAETNRLLSEDHELPALLNALNGRFVRPAPGGDLIRSPDILPTGRNLHGFDLFKIPSTFAAAEGARQAARLLERHAEDGHGLPESIAIVLWGTDNLKSEGGPISQAMALMGARPRFDSYGRLAGADLIPLEELGRPRVDVVMTLSGIFRDLLPLQTKMLAEAAFLAASADEPLAQNFVRKNALETQKRLGCDLETAALRVFSNADGAYGSNVNHLIDSGCWNDEDELAETYSRRKCFAFGRDGRPAQQSELLQDILSGVQLAYQNLESVELGVTTLDHYFDTLGGISRSIQRARGDQVPVYIGDETRGQGAVRTIAEQVALETRTRMLNPKWYEGMLEHGYEGVRQIEAHVTNTVGWSATTGQVSKWVYQHITQTYVLDEEMRNRLAELNPVASSKVVNRLIEAHERDYWTPDGAMLEALRKAGEELEDRLEGIGVEAAA